MPRILLLLLALAATALLAPTAALATGTVSLNGGQLRYENQALTTTDLFVQRQIGTNSCGTAPQPCILISDGQNVFNGVVGAGLCVGRRRRVACDPAIFTTIPLQLKDGDDRVFIGDGVKPVDHRRRGRRRQLTSSNGARHACWAGRATTRSPTAGDTASAETT